MVLAIDCTEFFDEAARYRSTTLRIAMSSLMPFAFEIVTTRGDDSRPLQPATYENASDQACARSPDFTTRSVVAISLLFQMSEDRAPFELEAPHPDRGGPPVTAIDMPCARTK